MDITYVHLAAGELDEAETALSEAVRIGHPKDAVILELAQIMQAKASKEASRLRALGAPNTQIQSVMTSADAAIQGVFVQSPGPAR